MKSDAFSFGVIFAGPYAFANKTTMKHESGHVVQLFTLGIKKYTLLVALPSVTTYWINRFTGSVSSKLYYSLPWERQAEIFGQVSTRKYYNYSDIFSWLYYIACLMI